jgi:hypothetical protein
MQDQVGKKTGRGLALVDLTKGLFFLNAAIWVLLGILFLSRTANQMVWMISILMFVNAALMLAFGLVVGKGGRLVYWATLAFLGGNILLTVTDQVGFADLITLLIDLTLLVLLILDHRRAATGRR